MQAVRIYNYLASNSANAGLFADCWKRLHDLEIRLGDQSPAGTPAGQLITVNSPPCASYVGPPSPHYDNQQVGPLHARGLRCPQTA